jgi:(1->4)-alpha-D-glucan 1-alpha-D-glucosylmutase
LLATVRNREPGELCTELLANPTDGRLKLYALRTCLHLRRRLADVFGAESNYTPLQAEGLRADHVVAFSRRAGDRELATVVPRWTCKRTNGQQILPIGEVWAQTLLPLAEGPWRDVFTGRILQAREVDGRSMVPLQEVWSVLPFAVLERLT